MNINIKPERDEFHCIEGHFSDISYYMTTINVMKVAEYISFASARNSSCSFAERIQRTLDENRARKEIFEKYLLTKGPRFFNSLVISVIPNTDTQKEYISVESISEDEPKLKTLIINRDVKKYVVDGQHRLAALNCIKTNTHDKYDLLVKRGLIDLDVPVVFIVFNNIKNKKNAMTNTVRDTRKVFTAVNKTAKKIDKTTALLIDDSDFSAVAARELLEGNYIDEKFVKWSTSTLNLNITKDPYITTLSVIDEMIEMCVDQIDPYLDEKDLSTDESKVQLINECFTEVHPRVKYSPKDLIINFYKRINAFNQWKKILSESNYAMPIQPESLSKIDRELNDKLSSYRKKNLLLTVAGQKVLFKSIISVVASMGNTPQKMYDEVFKRINELEKKGFFYKSKDIWKDLLINKTDKNNKMLLKKQNLDLAAKFISKLLIGNANDLEKVCIDIRDVLGTDPKKQLAKEILEECSWS